jgi:phosphate transport system permease protein
LSPPRPRTDRLLAVASGAAAIAAGALVLLIAVWLAAEASAAVREVGLRRLLGAEGWAPTRGRLGMGPMVAASVAAAVGALLLALPLATLLAVFRLALAPRWLAGAMRLIVELLAATPSVVVGLIGLTTLVPALLRLAPPGASLLAGIVVLALMILPTLALLIEAALAATPPDDVAAAAALALPRSAVLLDVALPQARAAIGAAALVALGRALGETMAVLMVCGNVVRWPDGLLVPVRTLTANIALEMPYAVGLHRSSLFATGLLLLGAALLLLVAGRRLARGGAATGAHA